MTKFQIEMRIHQDTRTVEAENWAEANGWLVFYNKNPQGGLIEYWRVQRSDVVSMTTMP